MSALSDYLSERQRIDGLSVRAFADRCDISPTTAQRLLTGTSVPDYETLQKVADKLPAPLAKLVELSGVQRPEPFVLPAEADKLNPRQRRHVRALVRELLISSGQAEAPEEDDQDSGTRLATGTAPRERSRVLRAVRKREPVADSDDH